MSGSTKGWRLYQMIQKQGCFLWQTLYFGGEAGGICPTLCKLIRIGGVQHETQNTVFINIGIRNGSGRSVYDNCSNH